jgi:hypothetical protein
VIDESYDLIENDSERFTAAFEQVRALCMLPQTQVLETVRPVLEHNHDMIMNTDWNQFARTQIQIKIDQFY